MAEQLTIPTESLRAACQMLLAHLAKQEGDQVTLDKDMFWSISAEQQYDVYTEPTDLTIGQLDESWRQVEAMLRDPSTVTSYGLVWLADVLRAVGQEVVR